MSEQATPIGVMCLGCGSSWDDARLTKEREARPELLSCCPERKMVDVFPASYVSDLRARLEKAEAELDGWQPIETAPKDGTEILGCVDQCVSAFLWDDDPDDDGHVGWCISGYSYGGVLYHCHNLPVKDPTHWRPLPAPPALKDKS